MIANYHTHTWRCHHALGTEREYVEAAIASGLKILGFSDHAPYPYPYGYEPTYKMLPSQLEDYVTTVLDLKEEYRKDIEIRLGLESEYYPALWEGFLRLLEPYPIDYLLLGQHFLENEYDDPIYCAEYTDRNDRLCRYCSQCMEALETGKFFYFAHPDLLSFTGDDALYEAEMTRLCRFCKDREIPLELNLLGIRQSKPYPREQFWQIAARVGNTVIAGCDAHDPDGVYPRGAIKEAGKLLKRCGFSKQQILEG